MISKKPFVFLDFDGTITEIDVMIAIMKQFGPEEWIPLKEQMLSRQISVRKGVGAMFSLIPSSEKNRVISFVKNEIKIRDGFPEFLDFCQTEAIEYKVISGGLDFYVYPLIEKWVPKDKILCNEVDFTSSHFQVKWTYPCDSYCHLDCGFCKVSLVRTCDPAVYNRVLIGDSLTDLGAARITETVIGRDYLLDQCRAEGIEVFSFKNFFDVKEVLKR